MAQGYTLVVRSIGWAMVPKELLLHGAMAPESKEERVVVKGLIGDGIEWKKTFDVAELSDDTQAAIRALVEQIREEILLRLEDGGA